MAEAKKPATKPKAPKTVKVRVLYPTAVDAAGVSTTKGEKQLEEVEVTVSLAADLEALGAVERI